MSYLYVTELYWRCLTYWLRSLKRLKGGNTSARAWESADRGETPLTASCPPIRQGHILTVSLFTLDEFKDANATVFQLLHWLVPLHTFLLNRPFLEAGCSLPSNTRPNAAVIRCAVATHKITISFGWNPRFTCIQRES